MNQSTSESITTLQERQRGFVVLFVSLFGVGIGQSIMFSTLPPTARELGLTLDDMRWVYVTPSVFWFIMSPIWGRRSDVWGRRPVILMSLIAYSASMWILAGAVEAKAAGLIGAGALLAGLMASRGTYGLFGSGAPPASQAYVADRTSKEERTKGLATVGAAHNLGSLFGPGLGALLVVYGLAVPYYMAACLALVSAGLVFFMLPERSKPVTRDAKSPWLSPFDPRLKVLLLVNCAVSLSQATVWQTVGFYLMDLLELPGPAAAQYAGWGFMTVASAGLFVRFFLIPVFDLQARVLVRSGIIFMATALAVLAMSTSFMHIALTMLLLGLGFGLLQPGIVASVSLAVKPEEQGSAAGLLGATGTSGHLISALIILELYQINPAIPYLLDFSLLCLAGFVIYTHPRFKLAAVQGKS